MTWPWTSPAEIARRQNARNTRFVASSLRQPGARLLRPSFRSQQFQFGPPRLFLRQSTAKLS
jgi:hypothetical protein